MLEEGIFPGFDPFVEFQDLFGIMELFERLVEIKGLKVLDPNVKILWKYNLFCYDLNLLLYFRLSLLLLLLLFECLQISFSQDSIIISKSSSRYKRYFEWLLKAVLNGSCLLRRLSCHVHEMIVLA